MTPKQRLKRILDMPEQVGPDAVEDCYRPVMRRHWNYAAKWHLIAVQECYWIWGAGDHPVTNMDMYVEDESED